MNQDTSDRKDRSGGGDVTRAEVLPEIKVEQTQWDLLNNYGPKEGGAGK